MNSTKTAVFVDGNNLFHTSRSNNLEIDYDKLLKFLLSGRDPLRAFFYTGQDQNAERQQSFLMWMRRNGWRVISKPVRTRDDGSKKANMDIAIAVDMMTLADRCDVMVLVTGDEDFVPVVNAVAYKGVRVEVAGFKNSTGPELIDIADRFISLEEHLEVIRKTRNKEELKLVRPGLAEF